MLNLTLEMKNFLSKMRSIGFRTRPVPSDDIPDGFFRIFYVDENSNFLPEKYDVELVQWKHPILVSWTMSISKVGRLDVLFIFYAEGN